MPYFRVCGRRWLISSDDLAVPALFFLFSHLICLTSLVVTLILLGLDAKSFLDLILNKPVFDNNECPSQCKIPLIGIQIVVLLLCSGVELAILTVSCRGSIINFEPRNLVSNLVMARYGIAIFEVLWILLAVVWILQCFEYIGHILFITIICGNICCELFICVSLLVFLCLVYDPAGKIWMTMQEEAVNKANRAQFGRSLLPPDLAHESYYRSRQDSLCSVRSAPPAVDGRDSTSRSRTDSKTPWKIVEENYTRTYLKSFNACFCCFCSRKPKNSQSIFGAVGQVFCEQFGYLDMSSTDYVAALLLINHVQHKHFKSKENFLSGIEITPNMHTIKDAADIKYLRTVLRLAMASGGWKTYEYENACYGYQWPWKQFNCATCEIVHPADNLECFDQTHICNDQIVRNDGVRNLNYGSVIEIGQIEPHDIVYCNFRSAVFQTAFIVVISPVLRKVVISIRGTMSLEDVFTDLNIDTVELPLPRHLRNPDWKGHKGIVQAAVYVKTHLVKGRLLERAFHVAEDHYSDQGQFDLLLTGHSLGAGTAAILGILLKETYPNLQVVCFSPPGGLLSLPAAEFTDLFTRTVILGKDAIPRMGKRQLENLRLDMLNVLEVFSKSKWNYMTSAAFTACFPCLTSNHDRIIKDLLEKLDYDELKKMRRRVRENRHLLDTRPDSAKFEQLYLPGRITHIVYSTKREKYIAICSGITRFDYDDMYVSRHMINDHFNSAIVEYLDKILLCCDT